MAKSMAYIENGIVVNIISCPDIQADTDSLVQIGERTVGVGDTYDGENFYRDGVKVLTPMEEAQQELEQLRADLADADAALAILGVTVDE